MVRYVELTVTHLLSVDLGVLAEDPAGQLAGAHLQAEQGHAATILDGGSADVENVF